MTIIPEQHLAGGSSASLAHVPSAATTARTRAVADVLRKIASRFKMIIINELQDVA
jgi:hypothetical protein